MCRAVGFVNLFDILEGEVLLFVCLGKAHGLVFTQEKGHLLLGGIDKFKARDSFACFLWLEYDVAAVDYRHVALIGVAVASDGVHRILGMTAVFDIVFYKGIKLPALKREGHGGE